MSSEAEFERLLREARETLPEPSSASSRRARERALLAARRRPPRRLKVAALLGVALAVALGLGVALGSLIAPSGTAANEPVGLGFLPEPGWFALQADGRASAAWQTIAAASNGAFDPEDDVAGRPDASGLPYATLLKLPADGIVIVASFMRESQTYSFPSQRHGGLSPLYPDRELPLRVSEATPYIQYGTQIRPEEPLGQYQLRVVVNGHFVDVHIYFGSPLPSQAMLAEAQRQLDRLVVASEDSRASRAEPRKS